MHFLLILITALSSFLAKIENSTLKTNFTISIYEGKSSNTSSYKGKLILHNKNFLISLIDNEYAFDGENLYVYNSEDEEITISKPSQEELININPIMYAKFLASCSEISERPDKNNMFTFITLLPKIQLHDIDKMEITLRPLNNNTYIPIQMDIIKGKKQTMLIFENAVYSSEIPVFQIDKPNATINDIR